MVDTRALAWALARLDVWNDPYKYDLDIPTLCMMSEPEIDAIATKKAFLFEAQANHLKSHFKRYFTIDTKSVADCKAKFENVLLFRGFNSESQA